MEDHEILDVCMENSYDLIMGKKSLDEILDSSEVPYILWNVVSEKDLRSSIFNDILDLMIKYYEVSEAIKELETMKKLAPFLGPIFDELIAKEKKG